VRRDTRKHRNLFEEGLENKEVSMGRTKCVLVSLAVTILAVSFLVCGCSSNGTSSAPQTSSTKSVGNAAQVKAIEDYAKAHDMKLTGVAGQKLDLSLYKASTIDPEWVLYQMPLGEGLDVSYFLLHNENGTWVMKGNFANYGNPQQYGAPSDLTLPPTPQ